jgi:alanine racemase
MEAKNTLGEARVLISREALLHNAAVIRRSINPKTRVCAMIKADAYGHGAFIVADTLCNFAPLDGAPRPVDALAVATIDEASALPEVSVPVLIFRPVENAYIGRQRARLEFAIRQEWVLTLCSTSAAEDVGRIAANCNKRASVQICVDTGMNHFGVSIGHLDRLLTAVEAHPALRLTGLCTHFASSDGANPSFTNEQLSRFTAVTNDFGLQHIGQGISRHAANSAAIFFTPASHLDMVRPGISLYGIDPTSRPSMDRALKPVMKWTAPLLSIRDLRPGDSVGYGQAWKTSHSMRIGVVPVGYGDGYFRAFSDRAVVLLHGKPMPVIGKISMDAMTIDLSNAPQAVIGDEVTLLDSDPLSPASVYRLAEWANTIPYEIFTRIGQRMHRVAVETTSTLTR